MNLSELVERQRRFDSRRTTTFAWSSEITEDDPRPLLHNVVSLAGEVGEIANLVKKLDRGDFDFQTFLNELPGELADVVIYVIKIAYQSGVELERALLDKMAANERRFPGSVLTRESGSEKLSLADRSAALAEDLDEPSLDLLRDVYRRSGLEPRDSPVDLITGALIAVRVARLAELEGDHCGQESAWKELEPSASAISLSYHQLADLARHDSVILNLFGIAGPAPSTVRTL